MRFQLGPGFLRRAPKDWLAGRAFPVEHQVSPWPSSGGYEGNNWSVRLDAVWEVQVTGREPYRFSDERRTAPNWCQPDTLSGKRFYHWRLKGTHGLMPSVGVPIHVNPEDPHDLWIDWDAAYKEHVPAWEQKDRVDLAVARRRGAVDGLVHRVLAPFAGNSLKPGEETLVDEAIAAGKAREAERAERDRPRVEAELRKMGMGPVAADEQAEFARRTEEMKRIYEIGRHADATVVSNEDSGRKLGNIPMFLITLDIDDGGGVRRRLVYEHVWGPRVAKRYKPGKRVKVRIDPQDPDLITLAS